VPAGGRIIIRDGSRHLWHRTMIVDVQNDGQNSICNIPEMTVLTVAGQNDVM